MDEFARLFLEDIDRRIIDLANTANKERPMKNYAQRIGEPDDTELGHQINEDALYRAHQSPYCGIVLAGGKGTRLGELTKVTNKHLLPVGNEPMIYHPIRKLIGAGIKDIMLITGTEHMGDFVNLLGSGSIIGCQMTYRVQDEAGGIAQALGLAKHFCCNNGKPVVLLGDNVFEEPLGPILERARCTPQDATIVLKGVEDPERYGVAELDHNCTIGGRNPIKHIKEKPPETKSNLAVTGIYVFPHDVFDVIATLKPSPRGELEVTDINNYYLEQNQLGYHVLRGYWTDAGTLTSWHIANEMVLKLAPPRF